MRGWAGWLAMGAAATLAQGQGVELGGRTVPKEKMLVFILMGNSALSGRDPARDQSTFPNAWNYVIKDPVNSHPGLVANLWTPAKAPLHVDSRRGNMQDPGSAFVKSLAAAAPDGYHVGALQISEGALVASDFQRGDVYYDVVMNEAIKLKANVTFAGLILMVGLVEGQQGGSHISNYLNNLKATVTQVREDLGVPALPYLHACYPVNAQRNFDTALATVRQLRALEPQISGVIAHCAMIPSHGLTIYDDNNRSHYDSASCQAWGRRTADTVMARGWGPGGSTAVRSRTRAPGRQGGPGPLFVVETVPALYLGVLYRVSGARVPGAGSGPGPAAGPYLRRQP